MSHYPKDSRHVTISRKNVDAALAWAKENCPNYITNDFHMDGYNTYDGTKLDFFFVPSAVEEITMFTLKFA